MFGTLAKRFVERTGFCSGYKPKGRERDGSNVAQTHFFLAVLSLNTAI